MLNTFNWLPSWQLAAEKEEALRGLSGATDDNGLTSEEEDRIAAQLLSQFPPFGSHEPKDWLSLGHIPVFAEDSDMFDQGGHDRDESDGLPDTAAMLMHPQQAPGGASLIAGGGSPGGFHNNKGGDPSSNKRSREEDWDSDEQLLWKNNELALKTTAYSTSESQPLGPSVRALERPSEQNLDWIDRGRSGTASLQNHAKVPYTLPTPQAHTVPYDDREDNSSTAAEAMKELASQTNFVNNRDSTPSRRYFSLRTSPSADGDSLFQTENRQHWMPDQLCKQCYSCETQFTVFRRRHHCRICGQVFCNQCSAFFIPHKTGATVRVCQMCYEQVSERGGLLQENVVTDMKVAGKEVGGSAAGITIPFKPSEDSNGIRASLVPPDFDSPMDGSSRGRNLRDLETVLQRLSDSSEKQHQHPQQHHDSALDSKASTEAQSKSTFENAIISKDSPPMPPMASLRNSQLSTSTTNLNTSTGSASSWIPFASNTSSTNSTTNARPLVPPSAPSRASSICNSTAPSAAIEAIREGHRHLGLCAAEHLERMCIDLLQHHAPTLWNNINARSPEESLELKKQWTNQLLTLATRCCATVEPNVRNGDLLDIRPYCKIKVIPGGNYFDCAYISGILFRKTVSHKRMAREVDNPRIMLLSGGIEFTRAENRIASLETLFEQEDKYMEILVGKILKLKPNILMTGRSVSRRAQELLLKAGVVLIQQVKANLLGRISRQTGATVISSTDHVMNQFGAKMLGTCHRFRLVTFRDNEIWADRTKTMENRQEQTLQGQELPSHDLDESGFGKKSIRELLRDPKLSNSDRQAALAANKLGENVHDGAEAVKTGLAKRGVAQTYIMLEGCPKHLGCTIVLRGASRVVLKQVKTVLRYLALSAYSLRLETSYLKERRARISPDFQELPKHRFSSSLCVDFGDPARKVRPWNGGDELSRNDSGEITAFDHGALLVTSIWMTEKSQCCPAEVKGICYYSLQDVSLGQFLRDSCFNLSLKCQNPNCKKSVLDHSLSFVHNDGLLNIVVEELEENLPAHPDKRYQGSPEDSDDPDVELDQPIATWTYCRKCDKMVSALSFISEDTWKFSFGKFLESYFYNRDAVLNAPDHNCSCQLQSSAILFFGCGRLSARFTYEPIKPFEVFVRSNLPIHLPFHKEETLRRLELISVASSDLFVKFDKHIDRVSREARSLFNSAVNRPEHLQTVLSELNRIGSDVDRAAKTLQEKVASVSEDCRRRGQGTVGDALLRFPWFARRYLFLLTSAWNEKLRAAGKAISAMKKLSGSSSSRADAGGSETYNDQLNAGIRRLRELNERYATFNIADMNEALSFLPGTEINHQDDDDEFEDPELSIDFSDGVDADVLASRRRLHSAKPSHTEKKSKPTPTKSLGTRRSASDVGHVGHDSASPNQTKSTPGGAVKSAFNRFFNRGEGEENSYVVDLGIFAEGRPSLPPGVNNIVIPVFDEQWSSIIAYSLSSSEYAKDFLHFSKYGGLDGKGAEGVGQTGSSHGFPDENAYGSDANGLGIDAVGVGSISPDGGLEEQRVTERRMLVRNKTHIKHTFRDYDGKGQVTCKFVCTSYWATQFHAVRQVFLSDSFAKNDESSVPRIADVEQSYIESLSSTYSWAASGGKSGASFSRTSDDRFVIKCISRTELQMFLDCATAYFEYLSKAFFHGLPTVLCKIVGVYQIGVHNRVTGKRSMEQVAVMQNIFYNRKITRIFDLKGSLRGRFAANIQTNKDQDLSSQSQHPETPSSEVSGLPTKRRYPLDENRGHSSLDANDDTEQVAPVERGPGTLLDGDFLEYTLGRPMPMTDRAKAVFQMSILNDTLFLNIINVLDYSILVGLDEEKMELVVGIIDFMRQYDILKQMERVGKSLPMVVGREAPTIIQPPLYKARFTNAMERYFMTVPSKFGQPFD